MAITVKLPDTLNNALLQRCAQEGRSRSEVLRAALTAYLAQAPSAASAWSLGVEVFGRYAGPSDLSENR